MLDSSAIEDMLATMMLRTHDLLAEIEGFLADTGMGPSYFGKLASGNSEVVARLRNGKRVWPETEAKLRAFMIAHRRMEKERSRLSRRDDAQAKRVSA
jgi:hypothetical protein